MECNCRPIKTIFISSITTTETGVVLIPSTTITASKLFDLNKYRLIIQCNLRATANLPVYIQTAIGNIPLWCRFAGNNIFPDQLRSRRCYTIVYGNNNVVSSIGQFVLQNPVCPTSGRGTGAVASVTNDSEVIQTTTNAKSK